MRTPEKAIDKPIKDGFNSEIVPSATPRNIKNIGGNKENSVLIPKMIHCKRAIVGATRI